MRRLSEKAASIARGAVSGPAANDAAHAMDFDPTAIIENLPIGVFVVDVDDDDVFACVLTNRVFDAFLNPALTEDPDIWNAGELGRHLKACIEQQKALTFEWVQEREVDHACYECQAIPQFDDTGRVRRILGTATDRTKQRRAEQHMLQQALHDNLTSLPNRVLFDEMLEQAEQRRRANDDYKFAVLLLNVDRLQSINDSLGHLTGDELLVALARRLQQCVRTQDVIARISGDEFGILLSGYTEPAEITEMAEFIHKALDRPFKLSGSEVYASVGIGIATSEERTDGHAEDVARDADLAMHRAKSRGRGRTETFRQDCHDKTRSLLHLEADIRRALDEDQFLLYFQPIVCLESGRFYGVEALTRWNHPEHGFLSPATFIPLAEETGMIVPLGMWALDAACAQLKAWQTAHPDTAPAVMCVNVSGVQMMRPEFVDEVFDTLARHRLSPEALKIEITETTLMENPDHAVGALNRLKEGGVPLAIDDFGTGHSSLSYLQKFPFDVLKIDRSFIAQMMEDTDSDKIVQIITTLAQTLGLDLIAEGIETPQQLNRVKELGCRLAQGFYFSKPAAADGFRPILEGNGRIDLGGG